MLKDYESKPGRRPVGSPGESIIAPARVVAFEVISEEPDEDGLWQVKILRRKPDGSGYEPVSDALVYLEDLNT
jgi:hypothetical protein